MRNLACLFLFFASVVWAGDLPDLKVSRVWLHAESGVRVVMMAQRQQGTPTIQGPRSGVTEVGDGFYYTTRGPRAGFYWATKDSPHFTQIHSSMGSTREGGITRQVYFMRHQFSPTGWESLALENRYRGPIDELIVNPGNAAGEKEFHLQVSDTRPYFEGVHEASDSSLGKSWITEVHVDAATNSIFWILEDIKNPDGVRMRVIEFNSVDKTEKTLTPTEATHWFERVSANEKLVVSIPKERIFDSLKEAGFAVEARYPVIKEKPVCAFLLALAGNS